LKTTLKDLIDKSTKAKNCSGQFKIIAFESGTRQFPYSGELLAYNDASGINSCMAFIEGLSATGGTNMTEAWELACNVMSSNKVSTIYFLTDGEGDIYGYSDFKSRYGDRLPNELIVHSFAIGLSSPLLKDIAENYHGNYQEL
jgi:uncharacterized protein with von Willebrand factor type A (vWA) domain